MKSFLVIENRNILTSTSWHNILNLHNNLEKLENDLFGLK